FAQGQLAGRPHRPAADRCLRDSTPRLRLREGRERLLDPPPFACAPDARLVGGSTVAATCRPAGAALQMPHEDADVSSHHPTVPIPRDSRGTGDCPTGRISADVSGVGRTRSESSGNHMKACKIASFHSTERRRSRTYPAVGYTTSPVLKTGCGTG